MSFSVTARNIRIVSSIMWQGAVYVEGPFLQAEVQKGNGADWPTSTLNLNEYLGNNNGTFDVTGYNFKDTSGWKQATLKGTIYTCDLVDNTQHARTCSLNLNLCVENNDGNLSWKRPTDDILSWAGFFMLAEDGYNLRGVLLGNDGQLHYDSFDLAQDGHYGNWGGVFNSNYGHYNNSGRNFKLEVTSAGAMLKGQLRDYSKNYQDAQIDISLDVRNWNGKFVWVRHDGPFGRDGAYAKFFEPIPFAGFVVAAIHWAAGNDQYAEAALAICAKSTMIAAGCIIGALIGGPVGAVIGAGLMTPIGILTEEGVASVLVKDPHLKLRFEQATVGQMIVETLVNMGATACGGFLGEWIGSTTEETLGPILSEVMGMFGNKGGETVSEDELKKFFKVICGSVEKGGQTPQEWEQAHRDFEAAKAKQG